MSPFLRAAGPCTAVALGAALVLGPAAVASAAPVSVPGDSAATAALASASSASASASVSASPVRAGAAFVPVTIDGAGTYRPNQPLEVTGKATPGARVFVVAGSAGYHTDVVTATADDAGRYAVTTARVHERDDVQVHALQESTHPALDDRVVRTFTPVESAWAPLTITGDRTFRPNSPLTITGTAKPFATIIAHVGFQDVLGFADETGRFSLTTEERVGAEPTTVFVGQVTGEPDRPDDQTSAEFVPIGVEFAPLVVEGDRTYEAGRPLTVRGTTTPFAFVRVGVTGEGDRGGQLAETFADESGAFTAETPGPVTAARATVGVSSTSTHPDQDRPLTLQYSSRTPDSGPGQG